MNQPMIKDLSPGDMIVCSGGRSVILFLERKFAFDEQRCSYFTAKWILLDGDACRVVQCNCCSDSFLEVGDHAMVSKC